MDDTERKQKEEFKIVEMGGESAENVVGDENAAQGGSTSGNGPVGRGEGLEGGSGSGDGSISGLAQKAQETVGNGLRTQSVKKPENLNGWDKNYQPKKKVPLWAVLVGIVVIIGGSGRRDSID